MLRSIIILISTTETDQLDHYLRICETWNTKTKCGGDARKIFNSPNPHTALFLTQNFPKFPQTPTFTGRAEFRSCNGHHSYEKTSLLRYFPYLPQRVWNFEQAMATIPNFEVAEPPRRASHIIFHRLHLCTEVGHGMATNPSKRDRYCGWKQRNEAEKVSAGSSKQRSSGPPCSSLCLHCPLFLFLILIYSQIGLCAVQLNKPTTMRRGGGCKRTQRCVAFCLPPRRGLFIIGTPT